jgi:uncharacterized protein (DUF1697 family)
VKPVNTPHAALLRGVNVSGKNMLPMKELARMFSDAGCANVRTYIQSGNVVFEAPPGAPGIAEAIQTKIEKRYGYRVPVILRTSAQLLKTIRDNPFLKAGAHEKTLYVYFLAHTPDAGAIAALDPARSTPDAFQVRGQEIYLHLPNGMGRSKLTNAYFDSKLSTICTARNWATVLKLAAMMAEG